MWLDFFKAYSINASCECISEIYYVFIAEFLVSMNIKLEINKYRKDYSNWLYMTCLPLFGKLPLSLTLLLLLPLQLLSELLTLADVALGRPVVRLQQLGLVKRPQFLQLLFVLRDELLDFWLQT